MTKYMIRILFCLIFLQSGCLSAVEVYPYESKVVELEGVLGQEQRFGPPNYGESPLTDEHLNIYVLNLSSPINVGTEDTFSELNDSQVLDVSKVQVVFLPVAKEAVAKLIGKSVVLRGSLSKQISSHDFYPVIFRVLSQE